MQASPQRWGDGVEQVDDAGEEDGGGGPPPDPPRPAVGQAEIGRRGPRRAHGERRHHGRVEAPRPPFPGDDPFERAGRPQFVPAQQHPGVQLGTGLQLDPAHPLVVQEDRREPQAPTVLLHHLAGGPHVGVEADPEVGELRLEGGGGDEAGIAAAGQPPRRVACGVVRAGLGTHALQGAAAEDRPHPSAQQAEDQGQHGQHDEGHGGGDEHLVGQVRLMGVADGPCRQPGPEMVEDPWRHRHPQEAGDGERDQQPPGVAPQAAVERAGHDETGEGRRVGQPVQPDEPGRVPIGLGGERTPPPTGRRLADRPRLGVGGRVELGLGTGAARRVGMLPGLHPHHADAGGRVEVQVDGAELLDPLGGDGGDGLGVGVVAGLVGPGLADDPPLLEGEEPGQRPRQLGVGVHRPPALRERRAGGGQVEQVAGDDEDARTVPGVEGPGELPRGRRRRGRGLGGQEEVAHHHDPAAEGHLDPGGSRLRREGHRAGRWGRCVELVPDERVGGRSHGPSMVEVRRR